MKKTLTALLLAVCLIALTVCGASAAGKIKYNASRLDLFDTVIMLTGYAESEAEFTEAANAIFSELTELHMLYDVYNEYDGIVNICTINANAGGDAMQTDARVIDLLLLAREIAEKSGGCTDVTAGSVLRLWHEARTDGIAHPETAHLPDEAALKAAAEHIGFDKVEIDAEANTVRILDPETRLDVGAIAKGYAAERVRALLPESYLLSAGGNVCVSGTKPDGASWIVGVQDPDGDASSIVAKVSVTEGAVVTSGDYQRYYEVDGVRLHHIIDLKTLRPADRWRSVTILCGNSGIADGLSTALFVLPKEEGEKLLEAYDAEAFWIRADGSFEYTEGFKVHLVP